MSTTGAEHIPVMTIDGPSGSGKGTIAQRVAQHLGWHLLDSGALYRILALAAEQKSLSVGDDHALQTLAETMSVRFVASDDGQAMRILLDNNDVSQAIRSEAAGLAASKLAALPSVRNGLLNRQQAFREAPGLVADGRDMGTVVFPDAKTKVFLTASVEERAQRRLKQLKQKGLDASLSDLLDAIQSRDEHDMNRAIAPLKPAKDAIVIDSSALSIDDVFQQVLSHLN